MADNQDRRHQKTVWDILPVLAVVGSIITAWVNLNGELTQVKVQQDYNEKYSSIQYENIQKSISNLEQTLSGMKSGDDELADQLSDLERTVTQLYTNKINKR